MSAPVIAYQLSLLGDAPKPCHAWRRGFWQITLCGLGVPLPDAAERQALMLTCETGSFEASARPTQGET